MNVISQAKTRALTVAPDESVVERAGDLAIHVSNSVDSKASVVHTLIKHRAEVLQTSVAPSHSG